MSSAQPSRRPSMLSRAPRRNGATVTSASLSHDDDGHIIAPAHLIAAIAAMRPALVRRAARLCGNRIDAEDLAQDATVKALLNVRQFRLGNLRAWLMTIMRNEFFSRRRRALYISSRRHLIEADDLVGFPDADVYAEQLVDALDDLSPKFRDALVALALFCTSFAYILYFQLLASAGATRARSDSRNGSSANSASSTLNT